MRKVMWEIAYASPPPAIKYCKKCGDKKEYQSSGLFRINAQRKHLDIWLIYKCTTCDTTWNMTLYTRINPKSIATELLERFHSNNDELARKYALDSEWIRKNGAEVGKRTYEILGDSVDFNFQTEVHITSDPPTKLKVAALIREKMKLSKSAFEHMLKRGMIQSADGADLKKAKLLERAVIVVDARAYKAERPNLGQYENEVGSSSLAITCQSSSS